MTYLSDSKRSRLLQEAETQGREIRTQVGFQAKDDGRDTWAVSLGHAVPLFSYVSTLHFRYSGIKYHYLGDRLEVALVSDVNADDDHIEGRHCEGMCLAVLHVPVSNVPDLGARLVVVDRQDTSELDAVGIHVGAVNDVLRQVLAHLSHLSIYCGEDIRRCWLTKYSDYAC